MDNLEYSSKVIPPASPPKEVEKTEKIPTSGIKPEAKTSHEDLTPIGVEHFGIDCWPEIILTPALDQHKTVDKIMFIENFIKDRIKEYGLKEGKESYIAIMKSMEDELGLTPQHESRVRIEKIFNLMKLIKPSEKKRYYYFVAKT